MKFHSAVTLLLSSFKCRLSLGNSAKSSPCEGCDSSSYEFVNFRIDTFRSSSIADMRLFN